MVEGKADLAAVVSLDGVGINSSRAIGRAFAGLVIGIAEYWSPQSACAKLSQKIEKQGSKAGECRKIVLRKRMVDNSRP